MGTVIFGCLGTFAELVRFDHWFCLVNWNSRVVAFGREECNLSS